jgi:pyridoxamine 5'-phosphate oxidase
MRLEYETTGIDPADLAADPLDQFRNWFDDAVAADLVEPNAVVLSTVDPDGQPWSRHLLLKGLEGGGFELYTNYESDKSRHLEANPRAALTFAWLGLHRQVNVAGAVERVAPADSDAYWAVRARGSQIGAWASDQSRTIDGRHVLTERYAEMEHRFGDDRQPVPRPQHWGGWRVVPHTIEFWQGRRNRLHDRVRFERPSPAEAWTCRRLSP